jgi:hypothetical protein
VKEVEPQEAAITHFAYFALLAADHKQEFAAIPWICKRKRVPLSSR